MEISPNSWGLISEYSSHNFMFLNKEIWEEVIQVDILNNWKERYMSKLKELSRFPPLTKSNNWKQEYMRIINYKFWEIIHKKGHFFNVGKFKKILDLPIKDYDMIALTNIGLTSIPKEIGGFKNLGFLSLRGNKLIDLPLEIQKLNKLERVDLSSNYFKVIPKEIIKLQNLKDLHVYDNPLKIIEKIKISIMLGNKIITSETFLYDTIFRIVCIVIIICCLFNYLFYFLGKNN